MLDHPICREGAALLADIDPDGTQPREFFERIYQRGRKLMTNGNDRHFAVGLLLVGLVDAAHDRGFSHEV